MDFEIKNYRCFSDEDPLRFSLRPGFGAFVGANNSGKSTILRFFFEFRGLFARLAEPAAYLSIASGREEIFEPARSVADLNELFCNTNGRDIVITIRNVDVVPEDVRPCIDGMELVIGRGANRVSGRIIVDGSILEPSPDWRAEGNGLVNRGDRGRSIISFQPMLRAAQILKATLYVAAFRNIQNVGTNEDYFDIKTGQAFVESWRQQKTGTTKADSLATQKVTRDIQEIFELHALEINASASGTTLQVFLDGQSYMLPELGSGLAQFILVFANAAVRKPEYILIDEPELNLHPSLQLDFLTTLGTYASSGVLFSTHSLGLALSAADQVYSVNGRPGHATTVRRYEDTPQIAEFVGQMSFSGYKELGFDQILLVEGPTELRTVIQLLRPFRKAHRIVPIQLGGRSLINGKAGPALMEIQRITKNVAAIVDSERSEEGSPLARDRQAFVDVCKESKVTCKVLDLRAIENYFSDEAVKAVKGSKYRSLQPYERLTDVSPSWSKEENWKIAAAMSREELLKTDLGTFLASL